MNNKGIIASVLIVVLIVLCGASLFAVWAGVRMVQDSGIHIRLGPYTNAANATETKTLNVSGPADLTVLNDFGDVSVLAGASGQVSVKAEKTAWGRSDAEAQAALKEVQVVYDQTGNTIKISVKRPVEVNTLNIDMKSSSVKFTITVPKESAVTLESVNGALALTGTSGTANLHTQFGALNLSEVAAEISAKTQSGAISATNIGDGHDLSISSEFGEITIEGANGAAVTVGSNNGALDLSGVKAGGLLKVTTEFGEVHVAESTGGSGEFRSNNGAVTLEKVDLGGALSVRSDFGDLRLTKVSASSYDLNSNNGKISLDGAAGPIKAASQFGEVKVLHAKDAVLDLSSKNGGISFSGSLGPGPHSLKSEFGNINLNLPAGVGLDVDLQTEFGKISSDFDVTVSGGKLDEKHWSGKINSGGAQLTVKNNNGNITLQILK
ncbi:MAG TPA: DUF4097 family beta strand repeat-containing protein [Anaerolineales bacterium]|jgi:DUF4097 and DUF4098 domain-containing protein YvlB